MKATLVHNATAGMGEHTKEGLVGLLKSHGFTIKYVSSKSVDLKESLKNPGDLVVVAGGDGTVDKVSTLLRGRNVPLAILALGTANNIAYTMQSCLQPEEQVKAWNLSNPSDFDTGEVNGSWGKEIFFESIGFGIFPKLIEESKKRQEKLKEEFKNRQEKRYFSLEVLKEIISDMKVSSYKIELGDKEIIIGNFLAVEVMNIKSLGPNIFLSSEANPSDGFLNVVLITEDDRARILSGIERLLDGGNPADIEYGLKHREADKIRIFTDDNLLHIDDEIKEIDITTGVEISVKKASLKFV